MDIKDFLNVLRSLVMAWPYEPGRLNTFTLFDQMAELETENISMTREDWQEGFFWARKWVNNGAKPGTHKKEYGLLAVEVKQFRLVGSDCLEAIYPVYLNVLNLESCARSKHMVDYINEKIIRTIIDELKQVRKHQVEYTDGQVQDQWITPYQANTLKAQADVVQVVEGESLYGRISGVDEAEVFRTFFGADEVRSAAVRVDVRCTFNETTGLNYDRVTEKEVWK